MQAGELAKFVRGVGQQRWEALWTNLTAVRHHFEYEVRYARVYALLYFEMKQSHTLEDASNGRF